MRTPEQMVDTALAHGDRRSPEYRAGMIAIIRYRMEGRKTPCPHSEGTCQADAFLSGCNRGHDLWRKMQQEATA